MLTHKNNLMMGDTKEAHTILISSKANPSLTDGQSTWDVRVSLDGELVVESASVSISRHSSDAEEFQWYLEDYLSKNPFDIERAERTARKLDRMSRILFNTTCGYVVDLLPENFKQSQGLLNVYVAESSLAHDENLRSLQEPMWELLESPALWIGCRFTVAVTRVCIKNSPTSSAISASPPQKMKIGNATTNILLVVARNTHKDVVDCQDLNPTYVLDCLLNLQSKLIDTGSLSTLSIEVVRPGTFVAFQNHLKLRGPGYFDLVHFDLHGVVAKPKNSSSATAFFLFATKNRPDGLVRIPATDVGQELRESGVQFVVMNACQSANAKAGYHANAASTFAVNGVACVLAMSFKVSEAATHHFLFNFYHQFILGREDLRLAASRARTALREYPTRPARFGDAAVLQDWVIPVCYSTYDGCGVSLLQAVGSRDALEGSTQEPYQEAESCSAGDFKPKTSLIGRDFDVLRLERLLIEESVICLYGVAGVGKTSLLQHLGLIWERTHLVKRVLYVNLAQPNISTLQDVVLSIKDRLLSQADVTEAENWLAGLADDPWNVRSFVLDLLGRQSFVLILDGLELSFSRLHPDQYPGSWSTQERRDLLGFIKDLLAVNRRQIEKPNNHLILIHRLNPTNWWGWDYLVESIGKTPAVYPLEGLRIADALQLSERIIGSDGNDSAAKTKTYRNLHDLECCLRVLQCNPLAMHSVLSADGFLMDDCFTNILLARIPKLRINGNNSNFIDELKGYLDATDPEYLPLFSSLCYFWHQGPAISNWIDHLNEMTGPVRDTKSDFYDILQTARDRGILSYNAMEVDWIHPIFTLILRQLGSQIAFNSPISLKHMTASRGSTNGYIFGVSALNKAYLNSLEYCAFAAEVKKAAVGTDWEDACRDSRRWYLNALQALHQCSSASMQVPLEDWPINLFAAFAPLGRQTLFPSEYLSFALAYECLLDTLLSRNEGPAIDHNRLLFVLKIVNHLTAVYSAEVKDLAKRSQFLSKFTEIVHASESEYGQSRDENTLYQISLGWKYRAFFFIADLDEAEAYRAWNKMLETDALLYDQEDSTKLQEVGLFTAEHISDAVKAFAEDEFEAENIRDRLRYKPFREHHRFQAWRKLKHQMWQFMENVVSTAKQAKSAQESKFDEETLTAIGKTLRDVGASHRLDGIKKMTVDPRWWPENFDYNAHVEGFVQEQSRMAMLEDAIATGHWHSAASHREWLLSEARRKGNIRDALQHNSALIEIYEKNGDLFVDKLEEARRNETFFERVVEGIDLLENASKFQFKKQYAAALRCAEDGMKVLQRLDMDQTQMESLTSQFAKQLEFLEWASANIPDDSIDAVTSDDIANDDYEHFRENLRKKGQELGYQTVVESANIHNDLVRSAVEQFTSGDIDGGLVAFQEIIDQRESDRHAMVLGADLSSLQTAVDSCKLLRDAENALEEQRLGDALEMCVSARSLCKTSEFSKQMALGLSETTWRNIAEKAMLKEMSRREQIETVQLFLHVIRRVDSADQWREQNEEVLIKHLEKLEIRRDFEALVEMRSKAAVQGRWKEVHKFTTKLILIYTRPTCDLYPDGVDNFVVERETLAILMQLASLHHAQVSGTRETVILLLQYLLTAATSQQDPTQPYSASCIKLIPHNIASCIVDSSASNCILGQCKASSFQIVFRNILKDSVSYS